MTIQPILDLASRILAKRKELSELEEEMQMLAQYPIAPQVRPSAETQAEQILAFVRRSEEAVSPVQVVKDTRLAKAAVYNHLSALTKARKLIRTAPGLYKIRH